MSDAGNQAALTLFSEGKTAFDNEDWVVAIRSFLGAVQASPRHAESYIELIRSYEAAAEEYGDPELLEQASKVCRDAGALSLDARQRAFVDAAVDRIAEILREGREAGD